MNQIKLYLAAAQAAATAQGKTPAEKETIAKESFLATGLKSTSDFKLFQQHFKALSGTMNTLAALKLPSENAKSQLADVE